MRQKAEKTKDRQTQRNEVIEGKKKKASTYAEKMKDNAEFFVWWSKLNDKEKKEYEDAVKLYGGK